MHSSLVFILSPQSHGQIVLICYKGIGRGNLIINTHYNDPRKMSATSILFLQKDWSSYKWNFLNQL